MIRNDLELNQSIEQLERMYRALAALRSRVQPAGSKQFQLMAEGPVDEIRKLQGEIDEYLGVVVAAKSEQGV